MLTDKGTTLLLQLATVLIHSEMSAGTIAIRLT